MKNITKLILLFVIGALGLLLYLLILKAPIDSLYCKKQISLRLYNFRQAVKKNGADEKVEENEDIKKFLSILYNECLKK